MSNQADKKRRKRPSSSGFAPAKRAARPGGNKPPKRSEAPRANAADSLCAVSDRCGACSCLDVPYDEQLRRKQEYLADLFDGLADEACVMHPICGMNDPFHFRNKIASPFAPGKKIGGNQPTRGKHKNDGPRHQILTGMYAAGTHRLVDTSCCVVENQTGQQVIRAVKHLMGKFAIEPYNEDTGAGFIRHAVVRIGHASGEVLVVLVTNGREFTGAKAFARELAKRVPSITSIVQNVNTRNTNAILGQEEHTLFGPGFILDTLCGLSFRISGNSFYQVNAVQTEVLYNRAIEMAHLMPGETVLDAYCGTGTIGLVAARSAQGVSVIGVDKVEVAIRDARNNATHNGVSNAEFVAEDAGEFLRRRVEAGQSLDCVLMDPPRAGSTHEFCDAVLKARPGRIVYISCNPETQARDVRWLTQGGYRLMQIQPVDMFPHTDHVENIVLLSRAESDRPAR